MIQKKVEHRVRTSHLIANLYWFPRGASPELRLKSFSELCFAGVEDKVLSVLPMVA